MELYKVNYNYFGKGFVLIEAGSGEEAEQKYLDGDYSPENENDSGYKNEMTGAEEAYCPF